MPYTYPKSLVAGTPENVGDLNTNLSGAAADWENAFSTYKELRSEGGIFTNGTAGVLICTTSGGWNASTNAFGPVNPPSLFRYDPADVTAASRANKLHIRAVCATNGTAPGISATVGLYPITGSSGGTQVVAFTVGSVIAGSTVTFTTPGANAISNGSSGDFAFPGAGYYAMGLSLSGTQAANSAVFISSVLANRQV